MMATDYVGRSMRRREDPRLLTGQGQYIDDLTFPGTVHMAVVRSPYAHARVSSIHTARATAVPGVLAVITGADLCGMIKPLTPDIRMPGVMSLGSGWPILAGEEVCYVGEAVAVVVATDRYVAEDAAELVEVEYEPLPVVSSAAFALQANAPQANRHVPGNVFYKGTFRTDGVDEAFRSAEVIIQGKMKTGRVTALSMEPRGCVAVPNLGTGEVELYTSTQMPHIVRSGVARCLGLSETQLVVKVPDVGGGFGMKCQVYPEEVLVVFLARRLGRPVKWIQDRREDLSSSTHARDHTYEVELAARNDGTILAVRARMLTDAGAYTSYPFGCTLESTGGVRMLLGPYRIREYEYESIAVATNKMPVGPYRGVAQPSCCFAMERMMDKLARKLGLDPAEVRRRNLVEAREMPYRNVFGAVYSSGDYPRCLERALEMVDYPRLRAEQATQRAKGRLVGVGISCYVEITGIGSAGYRPRGVHDVSGFDSATVEIDPTGHVLVAVSTPSQGQGHETTFAQLVADELGVAPEAVRVVSGDTRLVPYGSGTFASRSAVAGGGAIALACRRLRRRLLQLAADTLGVSADDIELHNGVVQAVGNPESSVTVAELARRAHLLTPAELPAEWEEPGLRATVLYDPPPATWSNGVHVAVVEVDPETAEVKIRDYAVVHDVGRMINPLIVEGQTVGGLVQGVGEALYEHLVYDEQGQLITGSLMDYLVPTSMEAPTVRCDHLESPAPETVTGVKGAGEGGTIGAPAAIANAVADAVAHLGIEIDSLPIRMDQLWKAMAGPRSS